MRLGIRTLDQEVCIFKKEKMISGFNEQNTQQDLYVSSCSNKTKTYFKKARCDTASRTVKLNFRVLK